VRHLPPRLSDQGRHPGDADRRSHGRALKILLVRLRSIGDVVFTTPAIGALARHFTGAQLTYIVEAAAEPVVRHHPSLSEVIVAERPRGAARIGCDVALARRLRAARFDIAVDFHGGPRAAWFTWATGARQRVGYALPGRWGCYTMRVPWTRSLVPPRHSVLNQWDLIAALGVPAADPRTDPVFMAVDPSAAARVTRRLAEAGVPQAAPLVVMHVSAGNPFRRWSPDAFAHVAATLARDDGARRIIITSGPSDAAAAEAVADRARHHEGVAPDAIARCGEFDLAELRAVLDRSQLYIGGDSGPLHIAACSRTPVVALFGPTVAERSMPWRDPAIGSIGIDAGALPCRPCHQRHCVPGDFRCLSGITPGAVVEAALAQLGRG